MSSPTMIKHYPAPYQVVYECLECRAAVNPWEHRHNTLKRMEGKSE